MRVSISQMLLLSAMVAQQALAVDLPDSPGVDNMAVVRKVNQPRLRQSLFQAPGQRLPASPGANGMVEMISASSASEPANCSLDVDGNGVVDTGDGQLIARYLFGIRGQALTRGLPMAGATRDAEQIANYLGNDNCIDMLDVDGNEKIDGLSDGLLIMRHLSGLGGDALLAGALGEGATRQDAGQIGGHLTFYANLGATLDLRAPKQAAPLLSGVNNEIQLISKYSGNGLLNFHMLDGPANAEIDPRTGVIHWTPDTASEGSTLSLTVSVTDGEAYTELTFALPVQTTTGLGSTQNGNTIEVTEAGSLQGLQVILPSSGVTLGEGINFDGIAGVRFGSVDQAPALPPAERALINISEVFRITPMRAVPVGAIGIAIPARMIPTGANPRDLVLVHWVATASEGGAPHWDDSSNALTIADGGGVTVNLAEVGSFMYFALKSHPQSQQSGSVNPLAQLAAPPISATCGNSARITCRQITSTLFPLDQYLCSGNGLTDVAVNNLADQNWQKNGVKWNANPAELVCWLGDARNKFTALGFRSDASNFNVSIEYLDGIFGFVDPAENYEVLHLDVGLRDLAQVQGTAVHEYFHHAQARSGLQDDTQIMRQLDFTEWITEGTARWFEDELYDDYNTYLEKERVLQPIMNAGVNAARRTGVARPYQRFAFFKLLSNRCPKMNLTELMNDSALNDDANRSGITKLIARMGAWGCLFKFDLGGRSSLAAALADYQSALVVARDISRIDAVKEPSWPSNFYPALETVNYGAAASFPLPAFGSRVYRFSSKAKAVVGAGNVLRLSAQAENGNVVVLVSGDPTYVLPPLAQFDTSLTGTVALLDNSARSYGVAIPSDYDVIVINASANDLSNVKLTLETAPRLAPALTVGSPQIGGQYAQRVIAVTGAVPAASRAIVKKVRIGQPLMAGSETIASVDANGNFSGKAILRLGVNTLNIVGLDGQNNAVTETGTISFTGIESATPNATNALIKSNLVFVLTWDSNGTDLDQYVSYGLASGGRPSADLKNTIWNENRTQPVGRQDIDNLTGYGPEVTTFFTATAPAGDYEVNINYYEGAQNANVRLDVLLNEGTSNPVLGYTRFFPAPLSKGSKGVGFPPAANSASWIAQGFRINCSGSGSKQACALRR